MGRYVISDHHFGHNNIIEYCDRPFSSVGKMDQTLLNRHYERVTADDVLIHLGDVAMDMQNGDETIEYFQKIEADLLLRGNHDTGLSPDEAPFPVLESCVLKHDSIEFYCTHRPENIPDDWEGWAIHGHIHNNNPQEYPFVAMDERRVNVSAELLNFRPLSLDQLTELVLSCPDGSRVRDVYQATNEFDWSPTKAD
jgi:calcineurin-like phosphoesterase family protein